MTCSNAVLTAKRVDFRPLVPTDHDILLEAVLTNVSALWTQGVSEHLNLYHYAALLPERGDFGILAHLTGRWVGVVWLRFFPASEVGYAFLGADVPELSICVRKGFRGDGHGSALMSMAFAEAVARGLPGVSLAVHEDNPAQLMYQNMGFEPVASSNGTLTMFANRAALARHASPFRL